MKLSVKKGDNVLVLAGKDAKKTGEVLELDRTKNRVKVAGVNIQSHHKKPRSKDDKGGIIKTEGSIAISNVQVICPTCKKATRVAHALLNGKNTRICKKCGASLDVATKPVKAKKPAEKPVKKVEETKTETKKVASTAKTSATKTSTAKTSATKTSTKKETTKTTAKTSTKKASSEKA